MDEKVKNKDADVAKDDSKTENLEAGLEDTFPASDPVSATRTPEPDEGIKSGGEQGSSI